MDAGQAPGSLLTPLTFVPRRIGTYRSEACCVADFNGDGKLDIAAGPYLYLAPDWKAVRIRTVSSNVGEDGKGYADDFCNLVVDVNKDGKPDILAACWFSKTSYWYENTLGSSKELWPSMSLTKATTKPARWSISTATASAGVSA